MLTVDQDMCGSLLVVASWERPKDDSALVSVRHTVLKDERPKDDSTVVSVRQVVLRDERPKDDSPLWDPKDSC